MNAQLNSPKSDPSSDSGRQQGLRLAQMIVKSDEMTEERRRLDAAGVPRSAAMQIPELRSRLIDGEQGINTFEGFTIHNPSNFEKVDRAAEDIQEEGTDLLDDTLRVAPYKAGLEHKERILYWQVMLDALGERETPQHVLDEIQLNGEEIEELLQDMNTNADGKPRGFITEIPIGFTESTIEKLPGRILEEFGGLFGMGMGALVGAVVVPAPDPADVVTVPAFARTGRVLGKGSGKFVGAFLTKTPEIYKKISIIEDRDGNPIDRKLATHISIAIGLVDATVSTASFKKGKRKGKGIDVQGATERALQDPDTRERILDLIATFTSEIGEKSAKDSIVELAKIIGENLGESSSEGSLKGVKLEDVVSDVFEDENVERFYNLIRKNLSSSFKKKVKSTLKGFVKRDEVPADDGETPSAIPLEAN